MKIEKDISGGDVRIPNPLDHRGDRLRSHLFARLVNRGEWYRQEARIFHIVDSTQADLLGHGKLDVTFRRYVKATDTQRKEATATLARAVLGYLPSGVCRKSLPASASIR